MSSQKRPAASLIDSSLRGFWNGSGFCSSGPAEKQRKAAVGPNPRSALAAVRPETDVSSHHISGVETSGAQTGSFTGPTRRPDRVFVASVTTATHLLKVQAEKCGAAAVEMLPLLGSKQRGEERRKSSGVNVCAPCQRGGGVSVFIVLFWSQRRVQTCPVKVTLWTPSTPRTSGSVLKPRPFPKRDHLCSCIGFLQVSGGSASLGTRSVCPNAVKHLWSTRVQNQLVQYPLNGKRPVLA